MAKLLAPSILNADFLHLGSALEMLNKSECDWIHLDIMDGAFVPNISFGMPIVEQVKKAAKKPLDVHLMIINPERYVKEFKAAGADILNVHYEASTHLHRTIQSIKNEGMQAAVTLNPHTPVHVLEDILPELDMVLLMSVNPGYGGQKFIPQTLEKIKKLNRMISDGGLNTLIEVDGGVDTSNAGELYAAGADVLVVGSYIFKSEDPFATIEKLKGV